MNQLPSGRTLLSLGLPRDTLTSLICNGYETVKDLSSATTGTLSRDLNITVEEAEALLSRLNKSPTLIAILPSTQSASVLVRHSQKMSTQYPPLDKILEGGLSRGQILEISGPPGSPKERLSLGIVSSFAQHGEEVVFVDCQNMTSPAMLKQCLKDTMYLERIHYARVYTLPNLLLFLHQLPDILRSRPKVSLLVISSISFPFQHAASGGFQKHVFLDKVKQSLSKASASHNLTIVTTSQLATKMVNADGTPGNFDSGAKGVMLPSLGPSYLPSAKTHRVILVPDGLKSGRIKLLSSPKYPPDKCPSLSEPYSMTSTPDQPSTSFISTKSDA